MSTETRSFTAAQLAECMNGCVVGCDTVEVTGVQTLDAAGPNDVSFIVNPARAAEFTASRAGASLISKGIEYPAFDRATRALIEVDNADYSILHLLELFAPRDEHAPGVHESATIAPGVQVAASASIGPHVSIEAGSVIGERCCLHPGVRIGRDVHIGDDSVLFHNVVISGRCVLGKRVMIHNGASIGADGFNYRPRPDGSGLRKAQHLSHVVIEDDVEIGANSCIDRGKFSPTIIGAGSKIDNLVHIGHNCVLGRCVVIAGLTGLAGSVSVEDGVMMGGQVAISEHATIGTGAIVCGQTGVLKTVKPGETVFGTPSQPRAQMLQQIALLRRLRPWMAEIEDRINTLEE